MDNVRFSSNRLERLGEADRFKGTRVGGHHSEGSHDVGSLHRIEWLKCNALTVISLNEPLSSAGTEVPGALDITHLADSQSGRADILLHDQEGGRVVLLAYAHGDGRGQAQSRAHTAISQRVPSLSPGVGQTQLHHQIQ